MENVNKYIFNLTLALFCITIFTTCKKYPENKFLECVNPRKVLEGQWYFNGYFVNDADSTMQHLKVFNPNASNPNAITLNIVESGSKKNDFSSKLEGLDFNYYYQSCSCVLNLTWTYQNIFFNNGKNELYIGWGYEFTNFFALTEKYGFWKIRKLTKKELILENELQKKCRIEFIK